MPGKKVSHSADDDSAEKTANGVTADKYPHYDPGNSWLEFLLYIGHGNSWIPRKKYSLQDTQGQYYCEIICKSDDAG